MNAIVTIRKSVFRLSQAGMAAIAGTSQATVSRWESGELHPDFQHLARIRDEAAKRGLDWDDSWFFNPPAVTARPAEQGAA